MGYFTETIALFEFKSDIARDYASKRELERRSGDHDKASYDRARATDALYKRDVQVPSRNMTDYRRRNDASKTSAEISDMAEKRRDINRKERKSCKESFSEAFDSIIL